MGGRGQSGSSFGSVAISLLSGESMGDVSPIITAGLMELRGSSADPESTLQNIDRVRFNKLKHEQLFVVDNDGFVLKGYGGEKHSVAFDVESALQWRGLTVTHRHPSEYGGTFSMADVVNTVKYGFGRHEASANEGRYVMRPTKSANGAGLVEALQKATPGIERQMSKVGKEIESKKFPSKKAYLVANRKAQLEIVHTWYKLNTPKYGYEYEFKERTE